MHKLLSPLVVDFCPSFLVLLADFVFLFTMADKTPSFSLYMFGTPMTTVNRLKGSDNYQSWANFVTLWFTGNGVAPQSLVLLKINILNGGNMTLDSVTSSSNP